MTSNRRRRVTQWTTVSGLHLLVTFVFTYPAAPQIGTHLAGTGGDKFVYMWNFWWFKHALTESGESLYFTHHLYHPTGTPLGFHDMIYFWSALSIPFQWFLDLATVFNLFSLICLPLTGLALYHLCREVSGSHFAAIAGSMLLPYSPLFLRHLRVSHFHYASAFLIPLFLLALWRYAREPRPVYFAQAAVYVSLTCLMNYYYAAAMGGIFVGFVVHRIFADRARWTQDRFWRDRIRDLAIFAAITSVLASPAVIPTAMQLASGAFDAKLTKSDYHYLEANSADLVSFLIPDYGIAKARVWHLTEATRRAADNLRNALIGGELEKSVFPGWVTWLALATIGFHRDLRRKYWPWLLLAVGALTVTLGPTLQINGTVHLEGMMPASLLWQIPVFSNLRGLSRFALFIPLAGGVAFAGLLTMIADRGKVEQSQLLGVAAIVVTLLFFLPFPTPSQPSTTYLSSFYDVLARDPDDFAVLNVPVSFHGSHGGAFIYEFAQTVHEKPIVSGYIAREPDHIHETYENSPFLQAVRQRLYETDTRLRLSPAGLAAAAATLQALDVRYVIVHRTLLAPNEWRRVTNWLRKALGSAVHRDKWISVFRTPQPIEDETE